MDKNYVEIARTISANLKKLRDDVPETTKGFAMLAQAAIRDGTLDKKTKELIALALGVAAHCDGCIGFHAEALVKFRGHAPGDRGGARDDCLYGRRTVVDVRRECDRRIRSISKRSRRPELASEED